jgi:alpha-aminoadipic semialdehyde synthase
MIKTWGIRKEDKNIWEKRVPLIPGDLQKLLDSRPQKRVIVQSSANRIYPDDQFAAVGAEIQADLTECDLIMGVKEMPIDLFQPKKVYVFFSHTIKGQSYNMPALKRMIDLRCTLIDYERIVDKNGRRLVFFGRYAGLAGMIDSLWAMGQRLLHEGLKTPFAGVKMAHAYASLDEAKKEIRAIGEKIKEDGLPPQLCPLNVGFTGYGNVSKGAQEIFDLLPHQEIAAPDFLRNHGTKLNNRHLGKIVYHEEHTVKPRDAKRTFDREHFFAHPGEYESMFRPHLDHLTMLINCIYWSPESPRLLTKKDTAELWSPGAHPRLRVIGDISCDILGGIECTTKETTPDNPVYVYEPAFEAIQYGVAGHGPVIMAVDNLPCELSAEASQDFSKALMPFMPGLLDLAHDATLENCGLHDALKKAIIVWQGALTPDFTYLQAHLPK